MKVVDDRMMDLVYYNNVLSAFALLPVLVLAGEHTAAMDMWTTEQLVVDEGQSTFWIFAFGSIVTVDASSAQEADLHRESLGF